MRTVAVFAVVAAVLIAIGVVAAELVREDPLRILFRRPVMDARVRGGSSPDPPEGMAMHGAAAGFSAGEV